MCVCGGISFFGSKQVGLWVNLCTQLVTCEIYIESKGIEQTFSKPSSFRLITSRSKSVLKPLVLLKLIRPVKPSQWACRCEKNNHYNRPEPTEMNSSFLAKWRKYIIYQKVSPPVETDSWSHIQKATAFFKEPSIDLYLGSICSHSSGICGGVNITVVLNIYCSLQFNRQIVVVTFE